jgi:hypothetical protein
LLSVLFTLNLKATSDKLDESKRHSVRT